MPPMKIGMMLHFYAVCEQFPNSNCQAYVTFVKQLLAEGMIERTTQAERDEYPGWGYRSTAKGRAYVAALRAVPQPVAVWTLPA